MSQNGTMSRKSEKGDRNKDRRIKEEEKEEENRKLNTVSIKYGREKSKGEIRRKMRRSSQSGHPQF